MSLYGILIDVHIDVKVGVHMYIKVLYVSFVDFISCMELYGAV